MEIHEHDHSEHVNPLTEYQVNKVNEITGEVPTILIAFEEECGNHMFPKGINGEHIIRAVATLMEAFRERESPEAQASMREVVEFVLQRYDG